MRKIFLTFIVLTFAHIVFAQNKQTIVVRPETAREKEERKMKDVVETFQMLGEFGKLQKEANAYNLNRVKNSKYSLYVEERLETWKKKGEFEKTADWQKRLNDSTAIKKTEIIESASAADDYARYLNVLEPGYYDHPHLFNDLFYEKYKGQYDSDKEVLIVNTFLGNIPIPIPLDEAKNFPNIQSVGKLKAHFFIQNDKLALLSLSTYDEKYTWENPSQAAQIARNKRLELEQLERNKRLELEQIARNKRLELKREQERLDSLKLATYNQKLDSIFKDYNRQLLQNPYNLNKTVISNYKKVSTGTNKENDYKNSLSSLESDYNKIKSNFEDAFNRAYSDVRQFFPVREEFAEFYIQGKDILKEEISLRKATRMLVANGRKVYQNNKLLKQFEVRQVMMGSPNALNLYNKGLLENRKGNNKIITGTVFLGAAAGLFTLGIMRIPNMQITDGVPSRDDILTISFMSIGGLFTIIGVPVVISGSRNKSKSKTTIGNAVNTYNNGDRHSNTEWKFGVTGNGVGLVLNF